MASGNTAPTSVGALQYSNRPSPLVEIVARNARLGSDGEILVDIDWRMRDTLGELTQEPRYRVDGISFYAERKLVATVQGYSDLNSSPPNPPFRPRPHRVRASMPSGLSRQRRPIGLLRFAESVLADCRPLSRERFAKAGANSERNWKCSAFSVLLWPPFMFRITR